MISAIDCPSHDELAWNRAFSNFDKGTGSNDFLRIVEMLNVTSIGESEALSPLCRTLRVKSQDIARSRLFFGTP